MNGFGAEVIEHNDIALKINELIDEIDSIKKLTVQLVFAKEKDKPHILSIDKEVMDIILKGKRRHSKR